MKTPAPLEIAAFKAWLETKPDHEAVGITCDGDCCPIACWLTDTRKEHHNISNQGYYFLRNKQHQLPEWAQRFVTSVDLLITEHEVSTQQARAILKQLERN